jgi:hypothetical protein
MSRITYPMYVTKGLHIHLDCELRAADVSDTVVLEHTNPDGNGGRPRCAGHQPLQDESWGYPIATRIELDIHVAGIWNSIVSTAR